MKVAVIHDWLVTKAGAEKVLMDILECYPSADVYTIVNFLGENDRNFLQGHKITVSFLQKLWFSKKIFRFCSLLMPYVVEKFDLNSYDLVISSSHALAKGVITYPHQIHICYCHTPVRYAWDMQNQYLEEYNTRSFKRMIILRTLSRFRIWDLRTINLVDNFVANSKHVAKRIKKYYNRDSTIIYPGVDVDKFQLNVNKEGFYVTASRLVPYKKIELIVKAFTTMPDKKLVVLGDGPLYAEIVKIATPNIEVMGYQKDDVLVDFISRAKAFIFAAEEDFGILPVEAQLCGTPVIAYAKGGLLESVVSDDVSDNPSGVFFANQDIDSIVNAVSYFEVNSAKFIPSQIREHALKFSRNRFKHEFMDFVANKIKDKFD